MSIESDTIKVFISYSHNANIPDYKDRILDLADRLRSDGIDCNIDQYEPSPPEGWQRWMLNQVDRSDFVLVACSEEYDRRFRGTEAYGKGKGATWEGGVIIQELYDAQGQNSKFIPITLSPEDSKFIPTPLRGATYYRLQSDDGYDLLYRHLTHQPETPAPSIGTVKQMPPRDRKQILPKQILPTGSPLKAERPDRVEAVTKSGSAAAPSTKSIRQLVEDALSDDDLINLCQDEFPKVHGQFTTGQTKSQRIRSLVEYAERQIKIPQLLKAIQQINHNAYAEFILKEVNDRIDDEIAELKKIGSPIYYSQNGKLIRENSDGRKYEYRPLADGSEELLAEVME
jgi:Effector-associated domain 7/TIR domain